MIYPTWTYGDFYDHGDVVAYEGKLYQQKTSKRIKATV